MTGLVVSSPLETATHFCYPGGSPRFILPRSAGALNNSLRSLLSPWQQTLFAVRRTFGRNGDSALRIDGDLFSELSKFLDVQSIAISLGTPGPHNKKTLLLMDGSDRGVAFAKVADRQITRHLLKNEAYWLKRFADARRERPPVPTIVTLTEFKELLILIQSSLSGMRPARLQSAHATFLSRLHDLGRQILPWSETGACLKIDQAFEGCLGILPQTWIDRYGRAQDVLRRQRNTPVETVPAHRDFVPWNAKLSNGELYVFDWEYAAEGYPPAHDLFHYILLPKVLQRTQFKNADETIKATGRFLSQFGLSERTRFSLESQFLAYLLDVCGLYISSWDQWKRDRVVESYGDLIDQMLEQAK